MLTMGAGVAALMIVLSGPLEVAWLAKFDWDTRDGLASFLSQTPVPADFVLVAIDEGSLDLDQTVFPETLAESPTLQAMAPGYPWPRSVYAGLVEKLLAAGARRVVFDILFTGEREGDAAFAKVLAEEPDRVVIGMNFDQALNTQNLKGNALLSLPSTSLLPNSQSTDSRLGFVNFWPERDHVTRAAVHRYSSGRGGNEVASLALQAVRERVKPPLPEVNTPMLIRFADPHPIPIIPFWQIFDPAIWQQNLQNGKFFEGKTVWVGPTAKRLHDKMLTPRGVLPGPIVHMLSAAALMNQTTYRLDHWPERVGLILVLSLIAVATIFAIPRPLLGLVCLLGLCGLYLVAVWAVWEFGDFSVSVIYPGSALFFTGLLCFGYDFTLERRERSRTRQMLDRYVSRDLVREALDHEADFLNSLGGTRKEVVVLFSDIRGFTTWSETVEPEEIVAQLNEYLSEMVAIVFAHEGSVDKFIGDAVMAVWGTIGDNSPKANALFATRAALAMQKKVTELNERWRQESRHQVRIGIGLHAGSAIFGNIGSEQKMEPTIIGDTVNVASRVEGLCKKLSAELILTAPVAEAIQPEFEVVSLNTMPLAGRKAEIEVFTLKILDRKPEATKPQ